MSESKPKVKTRMQKVVVVTPDESNFLVGCFSTGQKCFEQANQFTLATEVTSLAVTKENWMEQQKGGVVIGISDQF